MTMPESGPADFIPFSRPALGTAEEEAVLRVLRSGWLTTGREALEFENEFRAYTGTGYALAVSSATAGLHLSLEAFDLPKESVIFTTPYTFASSASVIIHSGHVPRFVDIDPDTLNINADLLAGTLEKIKGTAVMPVHIAGLPCDMEIISALALQHNLRIVEDCAHAFPVLVSGGKYAGTIGDTGVYSFYATKTITTGEGGMIVTSDPVLAGRMKNLRLHGIDRDVWDRYRSDRPAWQYDVTAAGFKYNMPDTAASIGRIQLARAEAMKEERKSIAMMYYEGFADLDELKLPEYHRNHAWHLYVIRLELSLLAISRDDFISELAASGIGTSVHFIPLYMFSYYRNRYQLSADDFPAATKAYLSAVSLPIYPSLRTEEVIRIIEAVKNTIRRHRKRSVHAGF